MKKISSDEQREQVAALKKEIAAKQQAIAELKKSEQQYRDALENANDLIHNVNADGHFLYANRLWRETLGYSEEEIRQMKIFDIVVPDYRTKCKSIFACMMRGEKAPPTETAFMAKDGRQIMVEGRCNPKFEDGKAVELLGIFRDVTARKQIEADKEALIDELKAALEQVKTLEGFIPICASCKKIRDDSGYWDRIEAYIEKRSSAIFSHSMCPECCSKLYPELYDKDE